tara:strand:+ start:5086 stop:6177 length:1092 start_codon:yes stop_codon:yes gene_type:complete
MDIAKQTVSAWAECVATSILHSVGLTTEDRNENGKRPPPWLFWGIPGIGKSSGVRWVTKRLSELTGNTWKLLDVRLVQFDAVDLRGVPYVSKGETFWALSSWLPNVERDGEFGILFLDELFLAIPSVQAAALQLILDRRLGDYVLPDGWYVVSASNRPEDRAGVMAQNSALCNRFQHREAILSVDAWIEWAIEKGLRPEVIAFQRFLGHEVLHEHTDGIPKGTVCYASPRTWHWVSNLLDENQSAENERVSIEGLVGKGPAAQFTGFINIWRKIGDIDLQEIIDDPSNAPIPDDSSTVYAISGHLGRKATKDNLAAFITFLKRHSPEFAIKAVRDATQRDEDLKCCEAYLEFKRDFIDINIAA